jgi:rhamnogalacturonyl hydrolase YesR
MARMDDAKFKDWLNRWEKNIVSDARNRYCDKEMGEEIGWLITPFMEGFCCGYLATGDAKWADMLVDWADSWIKRGVKEPDGYVGWPRKAQAAGG